MIKQRFTDIFIKRPVFATTLSLLIILIGMVCYNTLQLRQFPKLDNSVIMITTDYPGANAQSIEGFITTPIENALSSIDGLDYMSSKSSQGESTITLNFKLGYNLNKAMADVTNAVSSARYQLPADAKDPVITEQDMNTNPILYVAFTSNSMNEEQITDYLTRVVQPQLQTIDGVSQAKVMGERQYAMRIWLNPFEMDAYKVTPSDVANALANNNLQAAAGQLETKNQLLNLNATTDLNTAKEFNNLVIKQSDGQLIRIKNIGNAELGAQSYTGSAYFDGQQASVVGLIPKSTANPLNVAKEAIAKLDALKKNLPNGLHEVLMWNTTTFISASLHEVELTIAIACLCVMFVIFIFLGSWRSILIPIVTIPLSLIGTCALMKAFGFSINTLTLLAWVLAIGLVVDDAIVVLENIHRHIEDGMAPLQAALVGAREISFAVIAMSLTLVAVYLPIGFVGGLTGNLFSEFAFTLAGSLVVSGFIALTLSPMMTAKLISKEKATTKLSRYIDKTFTKVSSGYSNVLSIVLNKKVIVLIVAGLVYASCYFLYITTKQETAPQEDQGAVLAFIMGPTPANTNFMVQQTNKLQNIFASEVGGKKPGVNYAVMTGFPAGTNSGIAFMVLKPWSERSISAMNLTNKLTPQMMSIPGVIASPFEMPSLPGAGGFAPISFVLKTTSSYADLYKETQKFLAALRQNPNIIMPQTDLKMDDPQVNIQIDRSKAGDLGISMQQIGTALSTLFGQTTSSRFVMNGRNYEVIPQVAPQFRDNPQDLKNIYLKSSSGAMVSLDNLATFNEKSVPQSLSHFQKLRSVTITANLAPGYSLGEALTYLNTTAAKVLPKDIQTDTSDQSRQFVEASGKMMGVFLFALIFIYLILAAQFESFTDPLIVMVSVPLSIAGALITLKLAGGTMNIYTEIGLVTLIGLISKHGILIVEFANQQQQQGIDKLQAVLNAATIRLRPILMTTAAMVLGALPLAFAVGAGAESRSQLGWVIVGGMTFGTMLTLFLVPTVYLFLARVKKDDVDKEAPDI